MEGLADAARGSRICIRDARADDLPHVLDLNANWEHVTSPLDTAALAALDAQASLHRVAEVDGQVAAFVLALEPGADYASPNYVWFSARGGSFLYIDRVVVDSDCQRLGLGSALYDEALAHARARGLARVTCEVDLEPPNPASDRFHARQGFVEVGTQRLPGGKRVSLRELAL